VSLPLFSLAPNSLPPNLGPPISGSQRRVLNLRRDVCRVGISYFREPLNKSPLARWWLLRHGIREGDDANDATAKGRAVSSEGGCDPV